MGKKKKKKAPQNKKTYQSNCDSGRDDWPLCGRNSSDSKSPHNENEQEK